MDTIAVLISALDDAATLVQQHVLQLTEAEMAQSLPDTNSSVKDGLAQLIGWQEYSLDMLPKMLAQIDIALPPVDAAAVDRQSVAGQAGNSVTQMLGKFWQNHQALISLLQTETPEALMLRRARNEQIYTVKSYVLDTFQQKVLEFVDRLQLRSQE